MDTLAIKAQVRHLYHGKQINKTNKNPTVRAYITNIYVLKQNKTKQNCFGFIKKIIIIIWK